MSRDAPGAIAEWVEEVDELLPEITLGEIDARPAPHAIPVSGWRRFTNALASILVGVVLAAAIGWVGWQLVQAGDRVLERMVGPDVATTVVATTIAQSPTTVPQPELAWTTYGPLDGLPPGDVTALAGGPDGGVWAAIATDGGVSVVRRGSVGWIVVDAGLEEAVGTPRWLTVTGDGSAWMAVATVEGGERLLGFDGEAWASAVDVDLWGSVTREGPYGQLWVAALDGQLRPIRLERVQGQWLAGRADAGFPLTGVESVGDLEPGALSMRIALDSEGVAWFAADGQVVKFDGRRTGQIESIDDSWVAIGPQRDVWIPTEHGLRRHADGVWTYHDARHGLPGRAPVRGSLRFAGASTWATFRSGGALQAHVYDGETWSESGATPAGFGLEFLPAYGPRIAYTPDHLGGEDDPVWVRSADTWFRLSHPDGAAVQGIGDVCHTPDGTLWMAADGVLRALFVRS